MRGSSALIYAETSGSSGIDDCYTDRGDGANRPMYRASDGHMSETRKTRSTCEERTIGTSPPPVNEMIATVSRPPGLVSRYAVNGSMCPHFDHAPAMNAHSTMSP